MSLDTHTGNAFLDDFAAQINKLEQDPNATPEYDKALEKPFAQMKVQVLGTESGVWLPTDQIAAKAQRAVGEGLPMCQPLWPASLRVRVDSKLEAGPSGPTQLQAAFGLIPNGNPTPGTPPNAAIDTLGTLTNDAVALARGALAKGDFGLGADGARHRRRHQGRHLQCKQSGE
jgi:hypothetical protein